MKIKANRFVMLGLGSSSLRTREKWINVLHRYLHRTWMARKCMRLWVLAVVIKTVR